ncbi:hypothetical protein [Plantactinospora sonchi]|uniref:Uncharacterized protein n=1 Tax=Plantactinospora sonchi TaxID=1544735 RepID=A0ABU7RQW8_9ACTN
MASGPDVPVTVLPIGLFVGSFPGDVDDDAELRHEVRRGADIHALSDEEFVAWVAAHGTDGTPDGGPPSRSLLERELRTQDVVDPAPILDGLLDRGLLVTVPTDEAAAVDFARTHRVVPTMYGLGNSPEEPDLYSIGLIGSEQLRVTRAVFELWAWSEVDDNLWSACESFAEQERDAGGDDPELCDPRRVLTGFLVALTGLLATEAAHLDVVRGNSVLEGLR